MFQDLRALILDDKSSDLSDLSFKLKDIYRGVEPSAVESVSGAKACLDRQDWDIVVLDLNMADDNDLPDGDGERDSAGFYVYFHLCAQVLNHVQGKERLPSLVVLCTGNDDLQRFLKPFFVSEQDVLGRPFGIVGKKGSRAELEAQLASLEINRFRMYRHRLGPGTEALALLDYLDEGPNRGKADKLGEVHLAPNLRLKEVFPTLMAGVSQGRSAFVGKLRETLEDQDLLEKMNYLFLRGRPGERVLHCEEGPWGDFVAELRLLPENILKRVLLDLGLNQKGEGISKPQNQSFMDWCQSLGERFKTKWSRWHSNERGVDMPSVTDVVISGVHQECERRGGGVNVVWCGSYGSDFRLYVDPYLLTEVFVSVAANACDRAWGAEPRTDRVLLIRVVHHPESRLVSLDIADNGTGFDPDRLSWEESNFADLERKLRGWGTLQIFTNHGSNIMRIDSSGMMKSIWPDLGSWPNHQQEFGTVVRMELRYRHYWEYGQ